MAFGMRTLELLLAVAAAAHLAAAGTASVQQQSRVATKVTPLQKVIEMLNGMVSKGKEEKIDEEKEFAEFQQWCDSERAERTKSIKEAASAIMQLEADIAMGKSQAEVLGQEVAELEAKIEKASAEVKSATAIRDKEHEDYSATHKDLSDSIDACSRAVQVLKTREADVPQSLAQVQSSPLIPAHAKAVLASFLALGSGMDADAVGVPEANAYEFQSGGVVAMLEKLTLKFQDQLLVLEKEEMNAKASYEVLMQQLTDDMRADKAAAAKKTAMKASKLEGASNDGIELKNTESSKADDEKVLDETNTECHVRSEEYEKNQVTRAEEVKAIEKATEILSSGAVSGNAETYLPKLLQAAAPALVQLASRAGEDPQVRRRAVEFLQGRARKSGSRYLALVAARAAEDPFAKVKKMIKDLIVKLMEQSNAEADQHAYCTTELATNKQTREIKATEVEELTSLVDQLTAESARLASEIQELSDAIAEIKGQQAEATKMRKEEKTTNAKTVADAKEAQAAVEAATKVLRDYYAKAAEASLLQGGGSLRQEMSQAVKAPYKGMQDTSTGIFGMLEVVLSDFARLETETAASEEQALSSYNEYMDESTESVELKETEMQHKEKKRLDTDERARSAKKELELTQEELDKALDYYSKLKADCVDAGLSYEDRVRMREEEIQSLQEALKILTQESLG